MLPAVEDVVRTPDDIALSMRKASCLIGESLLVRLLLWLDLLGICPAGHSPHAPRLCINMNFTFMSLMCIWRLARELGRVAPEVPKGYTLLPELCCICVCERIVSFLSCCWHLPLVIEWGRSVGDKRFGKGGTNRNSHAYHVVQNAVYAYVFTHISYIYIYIYYVFISCMYTHTV